MTEAGIAVLFTRADGSFLCARWCPIPPVVFGVDDAMLTVLKGAIEAVAVLAGRDRPGARRQSHGLLLPQLGRTSECARSRPAGRGAGAAGGAAVGRGGERGGEPVPGVPRRAIRACFTFVRMDGALAALPAGAVALGLVVQAILLWSDTAFADRPALVRGKGGAVLLRPDIAAVIRAAHDPALPDVARDPSHALRLLARIGAAPE